MKLTPPMCRSPDNHKKKNRKRKEGKRARSEIGKRGVRQNQPLPLLEKKERIIPEYNKHQAAHKSKTAAERHG